MEALTHVDAERTLLGCVLLDPGCLYRVLPLVKAQDFSLDSHQHIYHAVAELAEAGKPVDDMTLTDALIAKGKLDAVGGVGYIVTLSNNVTSELARIANVEHYAELVLDKSRRRQARRAGQVLLNATDDISVPTDTCIQRVQESLLEIEAASERTVARHVKDFMPEVLRELETQSRNQGLVGMTTGVPSLDLTTGGIRPGELWTVGALPGKGKTALGIQIVLASASAGISTYIFSLEMQALEIGKRLLAAASSLPAIQIRNPQSIKNHRWPELVRAASKITEYAIYVDDRPSLKVQELLASARLHVRRHGVKLIVVDYLRLVEGQGRELRDRVGYVANSLRQLAKSEQVGVVLLSQLRRPEGGVNTRPSMLDLKESGDIEAHSHVVLLPYLPVGNDGKPILQDELLIIGKNRNGGVGSLPVYFDEKRLQFFDRTD